MPVVSPPPIRTTETLACDLDTLVPRFDRMSVGECARRRCALGSGPDERLLAIFTEEPSSDQRAWLLTRFGDCQVRTVPAGQFESWLAAAERHVSAFEPDEAASVERVRPGAGSSVGEPAGEAISLREMGRDSSPAVRFVNSALYEALKVGASDVHLETNPGGMSVKFRVDGALLEVRTLDSPLLAAQAINRIKVLAQLDIAEQRVPQDGRLQLAYDGRSVDVRVSVMPSIHGEDVVLRILDRRHLAESLAGLTLAKLGFDGASQNGIRTLARRPHGMLLVTGPTGSGKTTTLYAAIAETHESRDKIITIEDPVEYHLPGVLQIPVNEKKGLTFARGLRSILRHDPDKILVGEIRDAETAHIAVQAALTGHLVFTTVHANTVFDVVGRFEQFGIDAYSFASAINGVLAQRLLRRVCSQCATALDPGRIGERYPSYVEPAMAGSSRSFKAAVGCLACRNTGYAGRFALGEILVLTPMLKALVARRAPHSEIEAAASAGGWRPLARQALEAAAAGHTTLDEVERVAA